MKKVLTKIYMVILRGKTVYVEVGGVASILLGNGEDPGEG